MFILMIYIEYEMLNSVNDWNTTPMILTSKISDYNGNDHGQKMFYRHKYYPVIHYKHWPYDTIAR